MIRLEEKIHIKELGKLILNAKAIDADLENNWAVIAEAIQTILRRERYPNPYEALKELTRSNEKITREKIHNFIDSLDITDEIKNELKHRFDFEKGPLIRFTLLNQTETTLIINCHHAICDGLSLMYLFKDIMKILEISDKLLAVSVNDFKLLVK